MKTTSLKSQINNSLKNELFSLNQLVKFATKGDGKQYIQEYIKGKKTTLKELTVANLAPVMSENLKFTRVKNEQLSYLKNFLRLYSKSWSKTLKTNIASRSFKTLLIKYIKVMFQTSKVCSKSNVFGRVKVLALVFLVSLTALERI